MQATPLFKKNIINRTPKKERLDLLLIFPIWATAFGRGKLQRMLPPLGILSIASYLIEAGFDVQVLDLHSERLNIKEYEELLRKTRPRFVGITVLSNHFKSAHLIAKISKIMIPDCSVIVGGTHAELYPEVMLKNPNIDYVGRGDGENIMLNLLQNKPIKEILGLCFRKDNSLIVNSAQPVDMNLDKYPFPAYELIDFDNYFPAVGTYKTLPAMNALMTRGCPGKCTFCNSAKTVLRGRSPESMFEMLKMLRNNYGVKQITFYDDTFSANQKDVFKFCKLLIQENLDINFVCYVRGDMFTKEMAEILAKAGCHQVLIGIETGSDQLAKEINKEIDKNLYRDVVKLAHSFGIEVRGAFIIGHLNETVQMMKETLQFAIDIDVDFYQPSIMTPYPGTALFVQAKKENLLLHENYERYGQGEVILKNKYLTPEEIYKFMTYSFAKFYFRPIVIYRMILRMRKISQLWDIFKGIYVIFFEKFRNVESASMLEWHQVELDELLTLELSSKPDYTKLTYQVKQEEYLLKRG